MHASTILFLIPWVPTEPVAPNGQNDCCTLEASEAGLCGVLESLCVPINLWPSMKLGPYKLSCLTCAE